MSHTGPNANLMQLVDEFYLLLAESEEYQRQPRIQEIFNQAVRSLADVRNRLQLAAKRYVVAVVGLTNVGKSMLLNALLGAELAPRRNGPCTAAPIEFVRGGTWKVTAYYDSQLERPSWDCSTTEDIHRRLEQLAEDDDSAGRPAVRRVEVELPHALLSHGLVIADTPGFGAAQSGTAAGTHEESLRQYLQRQASQIFWVVLADQGIGKREMDFHQQFLADVCDDVVVTGSEDWDANDKERYRRRFRGHFRQRIPQFHFVSGLRGLRARQEQDPEALEQAGITILESRIRSLAEPEGRVETAVERIEQIGDDLGYWLRDSLDERGASLDRYWRPDSWLRWRDVLPRDEFKGRIMHRLMGAS